MNRVPLVIAGRTVACFLTQTFLALALGWAGEAALAQPTGLGAAFGLGEGSGSSGTDSSGNGNTGTASGAKWTAGRCGRAPQFHGPGAAARVTASPPSALRPGM